MAKAVLPAPALRPLRLPPSSLEGPPALAVRLCDCGSAIARMAVARCTTRSLLLLLLLLLLGGGPAAAKRRSRSGAPQSETSREPEPTSPAGASSSSDAPGEAAAFVLEDWLKERENECTL